VFFFLYSRIVFFSVFEGSSRFLAFVFSFVGFYAVASGAFVFIRVYKNVSKALCALLGFSLFLSEGGVFLLDLYTNYLQGILLDALQVGHDCFLSVFP